MLFIDVPRKVNNPDYTRMTAVPIEVAVREQIGDVLAPDRLDEAPARLRTLLAAPDAFAGRARELREKWVYNVGESGPRGAEIILDLVERRARQG